MQYLAALNVHLSGNKTISKSATSEFFHNLSFQALSKSDDSVLLKFDSINKLNKSIKSLLAYKMLAYENPEIEKLQIFFDPPVIAGDEPMINNKIESTIAKETLKDGKPPSDVITTIMIFLLQKQLRKLNKNSLPKIVFFWRPNLKKLKEILKL